MHCGLCHCHIALDISPISPALGEQEIGFGAALDADGDASLAGVRLRCTFRLRHAFAHVPSPPRINSRIIIIGLITTIIIMMMIIIIIIIIIIVNK